MPGLFDPYTGLYTPARLRRTCQHLKEEMQRSMRLLKKPGQPRLYYLAYLFRNHRRETIWGRLGAVHEHSIQSQNSVFCDLRVGTYRYDNVSEGGLHDNSEKEESYDYLSMPAECEHDAVKYALWRLTDARYREAADQFYQRRSRELHFVDSNREQASKVPRQPVVDLRTRPFADTDVPYWKMDTVARSKGTFKRVGETARPVRASKLSAFHAEQQYASKEEWLERMAEIFTMAAAALRPSGYLAAFIGDMYRDNRYHCLSADLAGAIARIPGLVWKANIVWYDVSKKLHLYGYQYSYIPSLIHQNILVFRKERTVMNFMGGSVDGEG